MDSTTPNILGEGPYVWNVVHDHVESTRPSGHQGHTRPVKLPLTVTVPMAASPGSTAPPGPFPVCVLLNGFQVSQGFEIRSRLGGGRKLTAGWCAKWHGGWGGGGVEVTTHSTEGGD